MKKAIVIILALSALAAASGAFIAPHGVTLMSASGPTLKSGTGAPSSTAPRGSIYLRTDTALVYQNTNGSTLWVPLAASSLGGTGLDGVCNFDGSTVVAGMTPSSSTYTFVDDVWCSQSTVSPGVTVKTMNRRFFSGDSITNNGTVQVNGLNASGGTAGATLTSGYYAGGAAGGAGAVQPGSGTGGTNTQSSNPNVPGASTTAVSLGRTALSGLPGNIPWSGGAGGGASGATGNEPGSITILAENTVGGFGLLEFYNGHGSFGGTGKITSGSGGGGGRCNSGATNGDTAGGGGGGAGTMYIEARVCAGSGTYLATGGAGANAVTPASCAGGGGGGGGTIVLQCGAAAGTWTYSAAGGTFGTGVTSGGAGAAGVLVVPVHP